MCQALNKTDRSAGLQELKFWFGKWIIKNLKKDINKTKQSHVRQGQVYAEIKQRMKREGAGSLDKKVLSG